MKTIEIVARYFYILPVWLIICSLVKKTIFFSFFGVEILPYVSLNRELIDYISDWRLTGYTGIVVGLLFTTYQWLSNYTIFNRLKTKWDIINLKIKWIIFWLLVGTTVVVLFMLFDANSYENGKNQKSILIVVAFFLLAAWPPILINQIASSKQYQNILYAYHVFGLVTYFISLFWGVRKAADVFQESSKIRGSYFITENRTYTINNTFLYLGLVNETYFMYDTIRSETHIIPKSAVKQAVVKVNAYL